MPENSPQCPVCHSKASALALVRGESALELRVLRCDECGHARLESGARAFEPETYAYYQRLVGRPRGEVHNPLNTERQRELLAHLGAYTSGRRLLDVGCGDGQLVATALDAGWRAEGIDLSASAIALCKSLGLPCTERDFFGPELNGHAFDAIVMSELVEHVPAPTEFIRRAEELLAPGGVLYLTTPNFDSLSRRALAGHWRVVHPEHLSYFCSQSLQRLAAQAPSLAVRELHTRNLAPLTLVRGVGDRLRRRTPVATGASGAGWNADQRLRAQLAGSRLLLGVKAGMNRVLDATRLGDTLFAVLQKSA